MSGVVVGVVVMVMVPSQGPARVPSGARRWLRETIVREAVRARSEEPREGTLRIPYFLDDSSGAAVIEAEVAELLESPCSLLVGSVGADGVPDATRAWGVEVLGPDRVRVLLSSNAARTLANLADRGRMALTATHFVTLVSWQLKGRAEAVGPATGNDRIRHDAFCEGCVHILHLGDGTPEDVIRRLVPPGIVACEMAVEQIFDQTPGPHAGACVAPEAG
jgi:hypothetical protein